MDDGKDRFGDKMKLVERAKENTYFAEKDREALQKLRAQLAEAQGTQDQQMVGMIDQALAQEKGPGEGVGASVHRILVPLDFSDCSSDALRYATMMAKQFKAKVVLVHVIDTQGLTGGFSLSVGERDRALDVVGGKLLADAAMPLEHDGIGVTQEVRKGNPYQEILKSAEEHGADLIVMGTNGRTGLERLVVGSVAERLVQMAKCPVLTVHAAA
jgi:nucleotide-binding universal stress UspA family protein